jgi:hypothetical protein
VASGPPSRLAYFATACRADSIQLCDGWQLSGIEARAYGSNGALICRLVEEFGVPQTLHKAKPNAVEFVPVEIPDKFFPHAYQPGEPWSSLFYANLVHNFMEEIHAGGDENQGNFAQSARVQEIINAVEKSYWEARWVNLPLES